MDIIPWKEISRKTSKDLCRAEDLATVRVTGMNGQNVSLKAELARPDDDDDDDRILIFISSYSSQKIVTLRIIR